MVTPDDPDARIEALTTHDYETPGAGLAAATETAAIINNEIKAEDERRPRGEGFTGFGDDFGDRLKKWLDKLEQLLKRIAQEFVAMSYSVTVAWPWGVSVTVTWTPSS
jgi:hypothetical protein